ncbi:MAG: hypothetical protein L0177_01230, partial [Chloroflexi bacterium]|nr:hypothetical protein [Chloroflexota bacterium]
MQTTIFALTPEPPYDFDLTANYTVYNRGRYGADIFEDGKLRRLLGLGDTLALATMRSVGTVDAPRLEVELVGHQLDDSTVERARGLLAWMLGADDDLTPFYGMALADPHLSPLAKALRGLHIPRTTSVYEALVLAILGQQISTHVARILRTLLIETYGLSAEIGGTRYFAFPRPETLVEAGVDGLRAIKFSQRKAEYVVGIASMVASGELALDELRGKSPDDVVRTLTAIRGVGPWTAHWLMIRSLGHTDGFPHGDLALQRTMGAL